ncbi:MAG: hypothetical protein WDM89_20775 [Rhizomicrobium sp.]
MFALTALFRMDGVVDASAHGAPQKQPWGRFVVMKDGESNRFVAVSD